jgi:NodT family efflux transporter outer membrane factor (OMF) lipoprotein
MAIAAHRIDSARSRFSAMRRHLALAALLPLLAACATGPKIPKPNVALPVAYQSQPTPAPANVPIDRWWALYNDPQLQALVEEALHNAPDARSALSRLEQAKAVRYSALSAFWPQGQVQGQYDRTGTSAIQGGVIEFPVSPTQSIPLDVANQGITDNYGGTFNVSWEADLFGRGAATRKKANADLSAARFDFEASRTSLEANVADQLFQARGLAIQLDDAKQEASIEAQLADVATKKAQFGFGATSDAQQANSQLAQTKAQVADFTTQLYAARRTLLVLIGHGGDPVDSLPTVPDVGVAPAIPASVPAQLLARRPDVREAAAQITSAKGAYRLDQLALFPTFNLTPGVGLSAATELGAATITDSWTLGASVAQPILDIPRLMAQIRVQGAQATQAVIAYEKAVQTAYGESDNALVQLGSDEERVRLLKTGEAEGLSAYEASKKRYQAGIDDLTTVLTAERTWRSARTALTGAEVQALRRSVQAFKALGGGWTPPDIKMANASR